MANPKKTKKKKSAGKMHRQVQDSVMALPYVIEQQKKEGKKFKAFVLRYISAPLLRLTNRILNARRYRGEEGQKLKQTEQMRRHLDHKAMAVKHAQDQLQAVQKKKRPQR